MNANDAKRLDPSVECGNGTVCANARQDSPNEGVCYPGCSPEGGHGSVPCEHPDEGRPCRRDQSCADGFRCQNQQCRRDENSEMTDPYVCARAKRGFACMPEAETCNPTDPFACGVQGEVNHRRCGFFSWNREISSCVGYHSELPKRRVGQSCVDTAQCLNNSICIALAAGDMERCVELCRVEEPNCSTDTCRSIASLTDDELSGPFGLCLP